MRTNYISSKCFLIFAKVFLGVISFVIVHLLYTSEFVYKEFLNPKISIDNYQIAYANFIDDEFINSSDSSSSNINKEKNSDLFYYILGIIILIAAGFILKQRYEQYLKQRDNSLR